MTLKMKMEMMAFVAFVLGVVAFDILMVWVGVYMAFDAMYEVTELWEYLLVQVWTAGYFGNIGFVNYKLYKKFWVK